MEAQSHAALGEPWNLIVHARPGTGEAIRELLRDLGRITSMPAADVFHLCVADPLSALEELRLWRRFNPLIGESVQRVIPLTAVFDYRTRTSVELEHRIAASLAGWRGHLAGKRVSIRREPHGGVPPVGVDHLGDLLGHLAAGLGSIVNSACADPDVILSFAGDDGWAGLSLWPRASRRRFPELGFDEVAAAI